MQLFAALFLNKGLMCEEQSADALFCTREMLLGTLEFLVLFPLCFILGIELINK